MRRLVLSAALLAAAIGCEKKEEPTPAATRAETAPAPSKDDRAEPEPARPRTDPVEGRFTLEQATEGLEGEGKLVAEITTDLGAITCELFPDKAPGTVASFVGLARGKRPWRDPFTGEWVEGKPFFDGLAFHRVIPSFMIQGGDPLSRDYAHPAIGTGDPGYKVPDEVSPDLKFDRPGRLAMANAGPGTNSGGSQFFITEVPRPPLDDNVDVVKQIARVPRNANDKPNTPVTMSVKISRK